MAADLSSSRVVAQNVFYNAIGFVASALYVVVLVPIAVHYVGLEQFGLWALMVALTGYLGLADLGVGMSFVKYIAEYVSRGDHDRVGKVVQMGVLFYFGVWIVVNLLGWLFFPQMFALLNVPAEHLALARSALLLSLFGVGIISFSGILASVLSGIQRNDAYNGILACALVAKLILSLLLLRAGAGILGLIAADIGVTLFMIPPIWWAIRRLYPAFRIGKIAFDGAVMKTLLKFGSQIQVGRLSEIVQFQFDKLILSRYAGLAAVSLYDFGSRPLSRIRGLPLTAASALVPAISALDAVDNVERINAALDRATRYTVYFALPLFGFLVCFAGVLVEVWLGPGFAQSALTMRILAVAFFVNVCTSPLGFISQGRGQPGYQMYATLLQICLNVVLSTLLVLWFGFFGAVAGTTTSVVVGTLVFYRWYGKKLVAHPFQLLMAAAGRPLAAFTVAAAFALAVHFALTALVSVAGRIALGAEILAIGSLFLVLYLYVLRKSGAINADDRRFLENILPRRFHGITHFL